MVSSFTYCTVQLLERIAGNTEDTDESLCPLVYLCLCGESVVDQLVRFSSTRRFLALPTAVLFDEIGTSGPKPFAVT